MGNMGRGEEASWADLNLLNRTGQRSAYLLVEFPDGNPVVPLE
jgi:hypothetical protein